jgi:hypothetical protein
MARPIRIDFIEYDGAIYHILARGNRRAANYRTDAKRRWFPGSVTKLPEGFGLDV